MPAAKKTATKKSAKPKTQPKAEAPAWNTIHIFGYGESQIIGMQHNGKMANDELKTLAPLLASLAERQQKGTKVALENTHAINIFNNLFIDFVPKLSSKNNAQRFEWKDIDEKQVQKLSDELMKKIPEQTQIKDFDRLLQKKQISFVPLKTVASDFKKVVSSKPIGQPEKTRRQTK